MRYGSKVSPFSLGLAILLTCMVGQAAHAADPILSETYRLRVENMQYGRVEISADDGAHYVLIGRVLKPTTATVAEKVAMTPSSVLRSRSDDIAFTTLPGQILKLRPQTMRIPPAAGHKHHPLPPTYLPSEPSAIVTTLEPGKSLFGALLPPFRSAVRLQNGVDNLIPFADAYAPTEEDVFVFLVSLPDVSATAEAKAKETLLQRIEQMRQTYAAEATARARATKRLVSGTLTLNAKLPANEPDPIAAVTFAIDGNVVAAENTPPFTHAWDTRQVSDGEHVVEIRALNGRGSLLTRVLALIVVQNTQPNPLPPSLAARSSLGKGVTQAGTLERKIRLSVSLGSRTPQREFDSLPVRNERSRERPGVRTISRDRRDGTS